MNNLKNIFFTIAFSKAARLAGKPGRILSLLAELALKLRQTKGKSINIQTLHEQFLLIGRMLKAHVNGSFQIRSTKLVLMLLAAIIYFINPLDLIPDFILGIGLADDFAVLAWVYGAAEQEIARFREWEGGVSTI